MSCSLGIPAKPTFRRTISTAMTQWPPPGTKFAFRYHPCARPATRCLTRACSVTADREKASSMDASTEAVRRASNDSWPAAAVARTVTDAASTATIAAVPVAGHAIAASEWTKMIGGVGASHTSPLVYLAAANGSATCLPPPLPTAAVTPVADDIRELFFVVDGVLAFVITLTGVLSNLANLVVLIRIISGCGGERRASQRSSSSVYYLLLAMAVADLGVMGVSLLLAARFYLRWPPLVTQDDVGAPPHVDVPSYFFFHTWFVFANVCCAASNWCVVATSLFRLAAVYFPFRARRLTSRCRALAAVAAAYALAVVVNAPDMAVAVYEPSASCFQLRFAWSLASYYLALALVTHVVPWLLCTASVVLTLVGLRAFRLPPSLTDAVVAVAATGNSRRHRRVAEQRRLTYALVAVATLFVVATGPTVVYAMLTAAHAAGEGERLATESAVGGATTDASAAAADDGGATTDASAAAADDGDPPYERRPHVLRFHAAARLAALVNYAANFFVYAVMNRRYREAFVAMFLRRFTGPASAPCATPPALASMREEGPCGAIASEAVRALSAIHRRSLYERGSPGELRTEPHTVLTLDKRARRNGPPVSGAAGAIASRPDFADREALVRAVSASQPPA